jgi:hemoglobin
VAPRPGRGPRRAGTADLAAGPPPGSCWGIAHPRRRAIDEAPTTPYERIGGAPAVAALVDAFYERVLADEELAPFFEDADMARLREMQRMLFTMALGGPDAYEGRPLAHAHRGRGIRREHLQRFVEHLFATLEAFDLNEREKRDVIARINTYSSEILGGYGIGG